MKNKVQPRISPVTAELKFPSVCLIIEIEVVGASYLVAIANEYPIGRVRGLKYRKNSADSLWSSSLDWFFEGSEWQETGARQKAFTVWIARSSQQSRRGRDSHRSTT
jgi:hypothetical protein